VKCDLRELPLITTQQKQNVLIADPYRYSRACQRKLTDAPGVLTDIRAYQFPRRGNERAGTHVEERIQAEDQRLLRNRELMI